jgi:hypothetical protein
MDGQTRPRLHQEHRVPTTSSDQTPRTHVPGGGAGAAIHDTRALVLAWIAVFLMIIGFGLMVLGLPVESARWPLVISGGVIGLIGIIIAAFGKIMDNVE